MRFAPTGKFRNPFQVIVFSRSLHLRCSAVRLPVVSLPHVPNSAAVRAPVVAAAGDVCRLQPDVRAGVPAAGGTALAGCAVLDDSTACHRSESGAKCDQAVLDFRVRWRVCISDLGGGTSGGHDLQATGSGGLE